MMEGLSEKVNQLLSDPEQLSQIMSLVQTLGGSPQESFSEAEKQDTGVPDEAMLLQMAVLFSEATRSSGKEAALFQALKPFVSPARCAKMDRAAEIAKLSHLAEYALRSFGDKK